MCCFKAVKFDTLKTNTFLLRFNKFNENKDVRVYVNLMKDGEEVFK